MDAKLATSDASPDAAPQLYEGIVGDEVRLTNGIEDSSRPQLHGTEVGFAMTWENRGTEVGAAIEVRAQYLDHLGVATESPFSMSVVDSMPSHQHSSTWDEGSLAAVWQENGEIKIGVTIEDSVVVQMVTGGQTGAFEPSVSAGDNTFFVGWEDIREPRGIYAAAISKGGTKLSDDHRLTESTADPFSPIVLATGNELLIAWEDLRAGSNQVYLAQGKYTASASRIDKVGSIDYAVSSGGGLAWGVTTAWTGAEYGFAWRDTRDSVARIYFVRLDADLTKQGNETPLSSTSFPASDPMMIWTGTEYGLVWQEYDSDREMFSILFLRLNALGEPLQSVLQIATSDIRMEDASVAWSGANYGVVWVDERHQGDEIYFAAVTLESL